MREIMSDFAMQEALASKRSATAAKHAENAQFEVSITVTHD